MEMTNKDGARQKETKVSQKKDATKTLYVFQYIESFSDPSNNICDESLALSMFPFAGAFQWPSFSLCLVPFDREYRTHGVLRPFEG